MLNRFSKNGFRLYIDIILELVQNIGQMEKDLYRFMKSTLAK